MARIMLITNDDMIRRYIGEKLKRAGHFVTRVAQKDVALTILSESIHDVLLLGVEGDEGEALSFAGEALEIDPEMRLIFIAGFAVVPLLCTEDDDGGLYDKLGEPAHLNQLVNEVGRMLAA